MYEVSGQGLEGIFSTIANKLHKKAMKTRGRTMTTEYAVKFTLDELQRMGYKIINLSERNEGDKNRGLRMDKATQLLYDLKKYWIGTSNQCQFCGASRRHKENECPFMVQWLELEE